MRTKFITILTFGFFLLLFACDKEDEPSGPPEVQFMNYTSYPALELNVDGAENVIVDSASLSSYITLEAGVRNFGVSEVNSTSNLALESKSLSEGKKYTLVAFSKSLSDPTDIGLSLLENTLPPSGKSNVRYLRFDFQNELIYGYPPLDSTFDFTRVNTTTNSISLQIDPNLVQAQVAQGYPELFTPIYGYDDAFLFATQQPQAEAILNGVSNDDGLWSSPWTNVQPGVKHYWVYYFKEFTNDELQRFSDMQNLEYDLSFIQNTNQHHGLVMDNDAPTHSFVDGESYTFFVFNRRLQVVKH